MQDATRINTTTIRIGKAVENSTMSLPSLYCIAVLLPYGFEPGLMEALYQKRLSLFSCDGYTVYSNTSLPQTSFPLHTITMEMDMRYNPETDFPLNTPVFLKVLHAELASGRYESFDWIVKVDPDTVFFPGRLQSLLADVFPGVVKEPGKVWLQNCEAQLRGAIEVISKKALATFLLNSDEMCIDIYSEATVDDASMAFGEDQFMQRCLARLNVPQVDQFNLLSDVSCDATPWPCKGDFVAFHRFVDQGEYLACVKNAIGPMWSRRLLP